MRRWSVTTVPWRGPSLVRDHRRRRRHHRRPGPGRRRTGPGRRRRLWRAHPVLPPAGLGRTRPRRDLGRWWWPPWTRWPAGWPTTSRVARAIGITNQRETVVAWDRRTGRPLHRAIVWQDRRTAAACRAMTEAGHLPLVRERTGLVLDPYFSATKMQWLLGPGGLSPVRRPGPGHGRLVGAVEPDRRGRRGRLRHRRHQCLAHHALRHRGPTVVDRAVRAVRRPRTGAPRGATVVRPVRAPLGGVARDRLPAAGRAHQRDGRRPARRPLRSGLLRPGHDQGDHRDGKLRPHERRPGGPGAGRRPGHHLGLGPRRRRGHLHRRRRGSTDRPGRRSPTPWRARCSSRGPACSGCATGWASSTTASRHRAAGPHGGVQRGGGGGPGLHRSRQPLLGSGSPGHHRRAQPGHRPGPPGPGHGRGHELPGPRRGRRHGGHHRRRRRSCGSTAVPRPWGSSSS